MDRYISQMNVKSIISIYIENVTFKMFCNNYSIITPIVTLFLFSRDFELHIGHTWFYY